MSKDKKMDIIRSVESCGWPYILLAVSSSG